MKILDLIRQVNTSKKIKRSGWVRENILNPESIADHSFTTVFLAMILGPKLNVDEEKLVKMAIVHDVAETKTGDIVWEHGKWRQFAVKEEKDKLEFAAIKELFGEEASSYIELFEEMQKQQTHEAKIFKQLDRLEMAIQALDYEIEQKKDLTDFFVNVELNLTDRYLREIFEEIKNNRPNIST